jgi:hypothetical protein
VAAKPAPFEIDADALLALPEPERSEELAKVARLKRQLEGNPLWGYVPHNQATLRAGPSSSTFVSLRR